MERQRAVIAAALSTDPGLLLADEATTALDVTRQAEVAAILRWRREDGDEDYHHLLRRDAWEVVLPELVFQAEADPVNADQNGSRCS